MNRALRALGTIAAAAAAAILVSGLVAAHRGDWGVFLDAARSSPGSSLHVRGDLPSTGPIEIVLVGADPTGLLLTTVDDAPNGHFETVVTVPSSVPPGLWSVEARAAGMDPARASLELLPAPPPGPDEEVPMDPPASALPPAASPPAASPLAPLPAPASSAVGADPVPFAAAGLAVAALAVLVFRTRRSTAVR